MGKELVVYKTTWELLADGLYYQAWERLAIKAKRAMRRRKHYLVQNGRVRN